MLCYQDNTDKQVSLGTGVMQCTVTLCSFRVKYCDGEGYCRAKLEYYILDSIYIYSQQHGEAGWTTQPKAAVSNTPHARTHKFTNQAYVIANAK
jgi:hypothetical protein